MKRIARVFLICIFLAATFTACDKVQQAGDAIDKARTFTDDVQKKVKAFIPASDQKAGDGNKGDTGDKGKEGKKEKDD